MKRKIEAMHEHYGLYSHGIKCKECINFDRYEVGNKTVSKCSAYGLTNSEATDWNGRNQACGIFNIPFSEQYIKPLIYLLKGSKRDTPAEVLENQLNMDL